MSTLLVEIKKIDKIIPHNNADTLSILQIGGWQVVAKTEAIIDQTHILYVPIDAIADKDHDLLYFLDGARVKTAKLRGVISQGLCIPLSEVKRYLKKKKVLDEDIKSLLNPEHGHNLAHMLDIRKYEPPIPNANFGYIGKLSNNPDFYKYTDIEHYANFVNELDENDVVVITEKLHGTSARYGIYDGKILIGSRNQQFEYDGNDESLSSVYSTVFLRDEIENKLNALKDLYPNSSSVAMYGEIAGPGIQGKTFKYGKERPEFFLYDISIDGKYLNWNEYKEVVDRLELQACPVLAGPIEMKAVDVDAILNQHYGISCLDSHIKEGIVVKPVVEKFVEKLGRVVLKIISPEYLLKNRVDLKNN